MSIGIGVFGKIPSYPEFVRIGSAGPTDRAFEKWLQMANDQLARADVKLSSTPIGFAFRDEKADSLLIGVLVGSRDKVGRTFPLAVYCEYGVVSSTVLSLLAEAFRPALTQLSMLAMTALETDREGLKSASERVEVPRGKTIRDGRDATAEALRTIPVEQVLARMFVDENDRAYGINVIQRACGQTVRDGPARPTCFDATVTSDMELCFAFAAAESQLPETMGPISAFWDVSSQRVVVVPGVPDSKLLVSIAAPHSQNQKIWKTETSSESSRKRAWEKVSDPVKELLKEPGEASIQQLLDRMRISK
ncbi:MAG: type VI secretion system-associated protein TagF [Nannocystaceae bacterium]|nr:type VI secretion system-associated protein TagF [bacterium]